MDCHPDLVEQCGGYYRDIHIGGLPEWPITLVRRNAKAELARPDYQDLVRMHGEVFSDSPTEVKVHVVRKNGTCPVYDMPSNEL
jgi:hypothetical protein